MGTIIIIGFGGYSVFSASIQLGVFIAVLQLSSQSFQAAQQLFLSVIQLQEAKAVYDRMIEFTNIELKDAETSQTNVESSYLPEKLVINNLSHRFNGRKPTFENVSFTIEKGQLTVLLGDSGSGKSTLVRVLDKLYSSDSGEIIIEPNLLALTSLKEKDWRKLTSVVHQKDRLFSGTVLQNILMSEDVSVIQERLQYCSQLGFDSLFSKFPQGYLTQVGKEGIQLSGGQRQLVSFARAVICNKPILLLDEPTTAMDKRMRLFVFDLLQRLKKDKLILIVTHLDSVAQLADKLVSMD
jgi:ATP-binding cassette subfamily B protein